MNGTVLGGRYELLEKIGEGGMSEVFKARCNKLNRFVAVKILKKEFCNNEDIVKKFKDEATAIATLSDNNIVNILDVGTQEDLHYIVMEYVKGKTLKDVIKQVGKMNYETAISVAIQIAKALDCAHRNNIIHRDVKPQNILVTEDGVMKVTDFGIAKSTTSATITNTTTIMGSAHYLSPEQAKGSFIDCRTDLYSLGIVLYEMVTGKLPFEADSAVTIALKHIQEEPVPPKSLNSRIPDSLNTLILKAIEKDPNKRYQTAKELINDLQKIKDNPNAVIEEVVDDSNQHTIIMSAVTEQIPKQKINNSNEYNNDADYYDDDDDDDEDKIVSRKRNKKILKIALSVGGVILIFGLIAFAVSMFAGNSSLSSKEVEVPNVEGKNVDEAKSQLEAMNLVLVEADTESSDKPEGTILRTNPKAGTMVKEKSEVRVVVSRGQEDLKMPDLREDDLNTAETKLKSLNLKISSKTEQYSSSVAKGQIISQDPAPDTVISEDQVITVVVSLGPEIKFVTVPSVVGRLESDAISTLAGANLKYVVEQVTTKNAIEDGIVLSQSVSGSRVEEGTTITIKVGKYNKQNGNVDNTNNPNENTGGAAPGDNNNNNNSNTNSPGNDQNNNGNTGNGGNDGNDGDSSSTPADNTPEGPWDDPSLNQSGQ